jgi:hypothetical protein
MTLPAYRPLPAGDGVAIGRSHRPALAGSGARRLAVKNGLFATAVLLPAGLPYVMAGLLYRLPVPVQPLKAFGAIAIAQGLGSPVSWRGHC